MFSVPLSLQMAWTPGQYGLSMLAALVCTWAILLVLLQTGWAWKLATDMPNHRSLHALPTPRVGGWGLMPPVLVGIVLLVPFLRWSAVLAVGLVVVSQVDDRRGLSARLRFGTHVLAAIGAVAPWGSALAWWWVPVIVVAMIWMMNLYNFMDGADGLAGGMTVIGFLSFAIAALPAWPPFAAVNFVFVGAALGFLCWNFPPARLFLGDAGSVPIGFLVGALALYGWRSGVWSAAFPVCVFLPFWADATSTLLKRLLRGERFWEAHREHYYQRMIRMDWGRRRVLLSWYVVMMLCTGVALALRGASSGLAWTGVIVCFACVATLGKWIDLRWKMFISSGAPDGAMYPVAATVADEERHG